MQEVIAFSRSLFVAPELDEREQGVLGEIESLRRSLSYQTTGKTRWLGSLRRLSLARAIRGSNSIEGYNVSLDDAVAAAEGEEPLDAKREAWEAVSGYRDAMTYILQLSDDRDFVYSAELLRSLHFMMVKYDLTKSPGRYRPGLIYVRDEDSGDVVYEGPDVDQVSPLMANLAADLNRAAPAAPAVVRAAMAHLNLVMIHPFRDGNGRMARALQTLVLAREGILSPHFCSVEEYLGRNTPAYYGVLATVGAGSWQPERDTRPWLRFMLTAHLRQAKTILRRFKNYERLWDRLEIEIQRAGLSSRSITALSDAAVGLRVRNSTYRLADEGLDAPTTAARDLKAMTKAGLLEPRGETRGRYYVGSFELREIWRHIKTGSKVDDMVDPFIEARS